MKHWFHPEARAELLKSVRYYEEQRRGLGRHFLKAITEVLQRTQDHPNMHPVVAGSWRRCRVPKFPFGVIYRVEKQEIQIIAVMHLDRQPGYWCHRTSKR